MRHSLWFVSSDGACALGCSNASCPRVTPRGSGSIRRDDTSFGFPRGLGSVGEEQIDRRTPTRTWKNESSLADLGAELDVDQLLGELLADRTTRWVAFDSQIDWKVVVPRHLVAAAAPLRRIHIDLASFVDDKGLHFRWKGGLGGYNWYAREVDARVADQVLTVPLHVGCRSPNVDGVAPGWGTSCASSGTSSDRDPFLPDGPGSDGSCWHGGTRNR
jgi:hypothetical protein